MYNACNLSSGSLIPIFHSASLDSDAPLELITGCGGFLVGWHLVMHWSWH
jgi:hypothetical protein